MQPTEFEFVLPHGLIDAEGTVHRQGTMRMATAYDEIAPLRDPRVQANPGYLVVILLARVVTRLGNLEQITPKTIESLFSTDFVYLQDLYQRINQNGHSRFHVTCPHCEGEFEVEPVPVGE
ncbi:phage tail assembly protein [Nostoc parmelioides]|uniref:Phage tail assembly protein n=1 Tax=Nostoc parmelioides FACHB-3921 TaxID=2692909 RepID=A0ABR8BDY3_9NOSO|nr:phage tail assembly protein [Nostoc parmelioides]MBD2251985.1 phage tail assembly protein [Nostoc parmelioides FACHB-3921]